jgi:Metallo-beta-lactamase superfamily
VATAAEFQRVAPGVFHWQVFEPAVKCDLSACALVTPDGLVFIDPLPLAGVALDALAASASPLAILLTSGNHERAADDFRRRFHVPICATAAAAASMSTAVDRTLLDGGTAPGAMRVIALPSAGPGEVAFIGNGVACIGDAVINLDAHGFSLLPPKYCADSRRLSGDLRKLLSYDFRILTFAHGPPLTQCARERLETLLV